MTKKSDYIIGILMTLLVCVLWALPFFNAPFLSLITGVGLIILLVLYRIYIKSTQFIYLSRMLIIPLSLWFVTAKDSFAFINMLGFVCVLSCLMLALMRYIQIEKE